MTAGMRMVAAGLVGLWALAAPISAGDPGCLKNPARAGACYWVHGTVQMSADRGFIVEVFGRHRALIVRPPPHTNRDWPENLGHAMDKAQQRTGKVSAWVRGVFLVCPVPTDQPGAPNVCIETAKSLRSEPREKN